MKKLLGIIVLGLLWCNVGFAGMSETIIIESQPYGADCTLKNDKNDLKVKTRSTVTINFSKKKLKVSCSYPGFKTQTTKLKLRRKVKIPGFNVPNINISNEATNLATDVVCFDKYGKEFLGEAACYAVRAADLAVNLVVSGAENLFSNAKGGAFSKKTPVTHTYATSIVKGVSYIIIPLSKH